MWVMFTVPALCTVSLIRMSALTRRFVKTTTTTTVTKSENDGTAATTEGGETKTVTVTKKKKSIDNGLERKDSKQEEVS